VYQGSLNFIIYFYFPILKELIVYVSYCSISVNNSLLVGKFYSSLVVSGSSRNELNSCTLFNFYCYFPYFYLVLRLAPYFITIISTLTPVAASRNNTHAKHQSLFVQRLLKMSKQCSKHVKR
jgi:hypothetical protein